MEADPQLEHAAPALPLARAAVDAGALSTPYVRAGTGSPVLLLDPFALVGGAPSPLVVTLAGRFRVVTPETAALGLPDAAAGDVPSGTAFSAWLRQFLDGLGLARVSVVAREAYALRALSFCLTHPLRVERLALLFRDCADPALGAGTAPDRLDGIGVPILVHRESAEAPRAGAPDEGASAVLRFLLGEEEPAHG